jgi:LemA protein
VTTLWIILAIVVILLTAFIYLYNKLVSLQNRAENAWSQISVQLKRRADLIPNLVSITKQYADHEKDVFKQVSEARESLNNATSPQENANASEQLTASLGRLFAVAEDYPDLKADQNYRQLQEELSSTENKIAYARQHYNDVVTAYNIQRETFPSNILTAMIAFEPLELFQEAHQEEKDFTVSFNR